MVSWVRSLAVGNSLPLRQRNQGQGSTEELGQAFVPSAFTERSVETRFYSSDKKYLRLKPMEKGAARELFEDLIELYERGMRDLCLSFPRLPLLMNPSAAIRRRTKRKRKKNPRNQGHGRSPQ